MNRKQIPLFKVFISEDVLKPVSEVLMSGYVGQGPKVEEFETLLKKRFSVDSLITLNSATSAEHLALHLLKKSDETVNWPGLNDGDEVISTPLTCTATNFSILANNLKIKWADIDPDTLNMDLQDLENKITEKTKVVVIVHWGGYPVDLERIKEIQDRAEKKFGFRPAVIEDCAHAFGSKYKGKLIGTHGNICSFSFQAIKHFTTVDGGMLVLNNDELYRRGKLLRWYGIDRESNRKDFRCEEDIEEWGFKFHMNDLNATIGIHNISHTDALIKKHQENAKFYDENLNNIPGLKLTERSKDAESAFWIYSILVENRDSFMASMKEKGIMVSQVHERNDRHTCMKEFRTDLPNLDKTIGSLVSIPVGWWVTVEDRQYIVDSIKQGW